LQTWLYRVADASLPKGAVGLTKFELRNGLSFSAVSRPMT